MESADFISCRYLKDDLSNTVLIYGIQAFLQDGTRHSGMDGFYRMREPLQCTLQTLYRLERVCGGKDVYVVENPAVFAVLSNPLSRNSVCLYQWTAQIVSADSSGPSEPGEQAALCRGF